jgi:hypothetical protein
MTDDNQLTIPRPFIDLFIPKGSSKPSEPRQVIAERYELCEDMAQMLTEHATQRKLDLAVPEEMVLERIHRGLLAEGSVVSATEAGWVTCRLAELLGWDLPGWAMTPDAGRG